MPRRGLVKCSSLFFIVFLMCPRRIRLTAPNNKQQDYFHAPKRSNDVIDVNVQSGPEFEDEEPSPNFELLSEKNRFPGYDLSNDEIRKFKLWPKGIVPYYIDVISFNDKVLRDRIRFCLNTVNSLTSISFLEMPTPPKDDKTRWVFFVNRRGQLGCSDQSTLNFTTEGVQHVNLGYDCISTWTGLADVTLSIVGVPPQHNSPDRDKYIKIIEENIMPEKRYLFHKLTDDQWLFHDIKYDFASAGHFHQHKHSANGRATIELQDPRITHSSMGMNRGFSRSDIKKIQLLYNYIVQKKENKVPECDKLFRKGHNFLQNAVFLPELKPRKKPIKYLGLLQEDHEEHHKNNKHNEHPEDTDHEIDTKERSDSKAEEIIGSEDGSDDTNVYHDEQPPATRKVNLKPHPLKGKHKIDLLSYLSDYQTGDENRRKAVHNETY